MKKSLTIFAVFIIAVLSIFAAQKVLQSGKHIEVIVVKQDTTSNTGVVLTKSVTITDYQKISIYLGGTANDSIAYGYKIYLGTQGMWNKVADDSLQTIAATSGVYGTGCKVYTYDIGETVADTGHTAYGNRMKMNDLNTDVKIVLTPKTTGNGAGTGFATKVRYNVFVLGQLPK